MSGLSSSSAFMHGGTAPAYSTSSSGTMPGGSMYGGSAPAGSSGGPMRGGSDSRILFFIGISQGSGRTDGLNGDIVVAWLYLKNGSIV